MTYFRGNQGDLPATFDVYFENHSNFDLDHFDYPYRGIHMIRDPRDIIVSGCFYHQHANESWLQVTSEKFGGLSYQQKICSYETLSEKLSFEMNNSARSGLTKIQQWNYSNMNFMEIKYEDLIADKNLELFSSMFKFLGFPDKNMSTLLDIAWTRSRFSGKVKNSNHIRDGSACQWPKYFNRRLAKCFVRDYGDLLIKLGYEKNNDWVQSTPVHI